MNKMLLLVVGAVVLYAVVLWALSRRKPSLKALDFIVPAVLLGLATYAIANFILKPLNVQTIGVHISRAGTQWNCTIEPQAPTVTSIDTVQWSATETQIAFHPPFVVVFTAGSPFANPQYQVLRQGVSTQTTSAGGPTSTAVNACMNHTGPCDFAYTVQFTVDPQQPPQTCLIPTGGYIGVHITR